MSLRTKEKVFLFFLLASLILPVLVFIDTTPFGFTQIKKVVAGFFILLAGMFYPYSHIRLPDRRILLSFSIFILSSLLSFRPDMGKVFSWYLFLFVSYFLFLQVPRERKNFFFLPLAGLLLLISLLTFLDFWGVFPFLWEKYPEFPPQVWTTLGNSNLTGEVLLLLLPFLLLALPRWTLLLPSTALILTFSKGNAGGIILGAIFYRFRKKRKLLLSLLLFMGFAFFFLLINLPGKKLLTLQGRKEVWRVSISMIKEKPLTGWGNFAYYFPLKMDSNFRKNLPGIYPRYAHNDFLQFWIEGGIFAFLSFVFLIFFLFRDVEKNEYPLWLVSFWGLIMESFVSFPFHTPVSSLLFFSLCGIFSPSSKRMRKASPYWSLFLLPLFTFFILFPFLSHIEFRKGNYYSHKDEYEQALRFYRRAVLMDPSHELAHVNLGYTLFRLGKEKEAEKEWWEALRINPTSFPALKNLLFLYSLKGEKEKAVKIQEKLEKIYPERKT